LKLVRHTVDVERPRCHQAVTAYVLTTKFGTVGARLTFLIEIKVVCTFIQVPSSELTVSSIEEDTACNDISGTTF